MKENSKNSYIKSIGIFSFFTMLSRIFGLLRDMIKAYAFGTGVMAIAFDLAFRLPNMLRNLLAEGVLSQSFIPLYNDYKGTSEERYFSGNIIVFLLLFLISIFIGFYFIASYLIPIITSDPNLLKEETQVSIVLSRILFPYIIFVSITSIFIAIQQSYKLFWSSAIGPLLLNLFVIIFFGGFLWNIQKHPNNQELHRQSIYVFSWIVLISSISQLIFQAYIVKKKLPFPKFYLFQHIKLEYFRKLFIIMLPGILGASVLEFAKIIDIFLAIQLQDKIPGALSALTYSHRLLHLPIGMFGVAIATVLLPQLSDFFKNTQWKAFNKTLHSAISLNLYILLPCITGIILLSPHIISVIFLRGEFDVHSVQITSDALQYYSIGILGYSLQKIFISTFYSQKNSRVPTLITAITLICNIILSIVLMQTLYHKGLALGSAISIYIGISIYFILLIKRKIIYLNKIFFYNIGKIIFINIIFLLFLKLLFPYLNKVYTSSQFHTEGILALTVNVGIGVIGYFILSVLFKVKEYKYFKQVFFKKNRKAS